MGTHSWRRNKVDQIYARIKRFRLNPYRRIVSGEKLFDAEVKDPASCIEYDPNTLLDEDDWYKVSSFRSQTFCPDIIKSELKSVDIDDIKKNEFEKISFLMSVQNGIHFFQRVRPSTFMRKKSISFGDVAILENPVNRILINPQPDAVFLPKEDVVLFRDLAAISPLFPGIDQLFKEATADQVQQFLNYDFIASDLQPSSVSKPNRKRIALAMDTLSKMSALEKKEVVQYIRVYCEDKLQFNKDDNVFKISTDDDLKNLVYGIEQRFYTTQVGSEKRLANSIVRI